MKKVVVAIVSVGLVLGLFTGCIIIVEAPPATSASTAPSETTAPAAPSASTTTSGSGLTVEDILENFEKMLEPLADQFQAVRLETVDLEGGIVCQPVVIKDITLERNYHLSIYYTPVGGVETVILNVARGTTTKFDFAILSYYLYKSMELTKLDADSFYDCFNMLTEEPAGVLTEDGLTMLVDTTDKLLLFTAYVPDTQ